MKSGNLKLLEPSGLLQVCNGTDLTLRLFQSSTCFEQTRARHQEVNSINTASGVVTLKASEWSKITKIQFNCIVYKTLTSNVKMLVKSFKMW